jgi:hypothetical protein
MGAKEMADVRRRVTIPAKDWIRLSVEFFADPDSEEAIPKIGLECKSCDTRLIWDEGAGWWECGACGMELTPKELVYFFKDCVNLINSVIRSEDAVADDSVVGAESTGRWQVAWTKELLKTLKGEAIVKGSEALQQLLTRFLGK